MRTKFFLTAMLVGATIACGVGLTHAAAFADAGSREGCLNQWLFNGVWRVQVTKVEPFMDGTKQVGWLVTEVWRNGTGVGLSPTQTRLLDQKLELTTGSISAKDSTAGTMSMGGLGFNTFAPAGQFTYQQKFYATNIDPSNKPKGLEITFDGEHQDKSKPQFTTSKYNFHFKLDCVATGAEAQAQGGSTQIPAIEGCMNQWMSNGVWKMRVTAIGPRPPNSQPSGQYGWDVTQEWVNVTTSQVLPGPLYDKGHEIKPTNVTDEYLVTQSGNNASTANVAGGFSLGGRNVAFPPGGSFTFAQLFAWSPFDATDKPVRLLVTFDVAKQNVLADVPHYKVKPANFRINLECTK
jgi:hypothetical protein